LFIEAFRVGSTNDVAQIGEWIRQKKSFLQSLEGKVLITPVTHEKDGVYCTTFPAVYGCGDTTEESRKVFEQRVEEVERNA
jgi:hypothetical protein